jgi:hypothetical protein
MDKYSAKLDVIDSKLDSLEGIEDKLEHLVSKEEDQIKRLEKEEGSIEHEERRIEKSLLKLGNFTIRRTHLLELARGVAGAFVGVGLGQALGGSVALAKKLPTANAIGILIFIFIMVGILVYRYDKQYITGNPWVYLVRKIGLLYVISIVVQIIGLQLFDAFPGWNVILVKALIVGSYPAMSAAVAFTLV